MGKVDQIVVFGIFGILFIVRFVGFEMVFEGIGQVFGVGGFLRLEWVDQDYFFCNLLLVGIF